MYRFAYFLNKYNQFAIKKYCRDTKMDYGSACWKILNLGYLVSSVWISSTVLDWEVDV